MSVFQANDSTLGYLYQFRFALLNALRSWRRGESFDVFIERADDVEFRVDSEPASLYQLKHSLKSPGDLTDKSPDWWRTLRIWCEGTANGSIATDARFYLVTSDSAPTGSAAESLTYGTSRNPTLALQLLSTAANTSKNKKNKAGIKAWTNLTSTQLSSLISRVHVLESSENVEAVRESTKAEIRPAVEEEHVGMFVERMEGWWVTRVVSQLAAPTPSPITSDQISAMIGDLREQFSREALPVDPDIMKLVADLAQHGDNTLVHQMQIIEASEYRVMQAVRDYMRAMAQRSRWVSGQLLLVDEMDQYEDRLKEEWRLAHAQRCDELGAEATEQEMKQTGRRILTWAESGSHHLQIRAKVDQPFLVRGSLQHLAETMEIGWHPHFAERVAAIIGSESK